MQKCNRERKKKLLSEIVARASGSGRKRKCSKLVACLHFAFQWTHICKVSDDQYCLTIVLIAFFSYLHWRSLIFSSAIFLVYYMAENFTYFLLLKLTKPNSFSIERTHTRSNELVSDPLIFFMALFSAWFMLDYSAIGFGVGADRTSARNNFGQARFLVDMLLCFLAGVNKLYWPVALLFLCETWTFHFFTATTYSLWFTIRASYVIATAFFVGFVKPFRAHYSYNALYYVLTITWFSCLTHFISINSET